MVTKAYLLERPKPHSALRRFADQKLVPAMLNAVAPAEGVLYHLSEGSKRHPMAALLAAFACGYVLRRAISPRPRSRAVRARIHVRRR